MVKLRYLNGNIHEKVSKIIYAQEFIYLIADTYTYSYNRLLS